MPQFRYEVRDKTGKVLRGVMDAPTEAEARQRLEARGYAVHIMIPVGGQPSRSAAVAGVPPQQVAPEQVFSTTAPPKEMVVFFRSLASYMQSGVLVYQAVTEIGNQTPSRGLRFICQRLSAYLLAGQQLSTAMAQFPRAFPPHIVGVVLAGELGGFLAVVLGDLALDYEMAQQATLRYGKMWVTVLWVNALLTIPLLPIPPMAFSGNATLENIMPGLMNGVQFSLKYVVTPMAILLMLLIVMVIILRQPSMRLTADRLLLKVPGSGNASRNRSLASFARILWRLQNAGIPPIQSWDAAARAAENVAISAQLYGQMTAIRSGKRLSEAFSSSGLFSSEDHRALSVGETTGRVPDALQRMALYYEDLAMVSQTRARWRALRFALLANLIVMGAVMISLALVEPALMKFVDEQFLQE